MTGAELLNCVKTSEVYYDYKSSPDPEDEDTTPRLGSSDSAKESANMVNGDGINLPDLTGVTTEEVGELTQLLEYAKPNDQIRGGLLEGSLLQECINVCVLRCQTTDPDLSIFGAYLRSEVSAKDLGSRATRLRRLKRICYIDDKGIIRRKDDPYRKVGTTQEDDIGSVLTLGRGVIHLGRTRYSRYFVRILAAIEHYSKGHQGSPKVTSELRQHYYCHGLSRLARTTLKSCMPCTKARAVRKHNYIVNKVQELITTGLWELVGADLVGPYDRPSKSRSTSVQPALDPSKDYYILVVMDYVSGFCAARPVRSTKPQIVADAFNSIFLEHGSPSALLTDCDRVSLIRKEVKTVLQRHGTRHYALPAYGQLLGFWERSHKDLTEIVKATRTSRPAPTTGSLPPPSVDSYINDYLYAIRCYNSTRRGWSNATPMELHYCYGLRLPGQRPGISELIDWDSLELRFTNTDTISFLREGLSTMDDQRERVAATLAEYLERWKAKQLQLHERTIRDHPNDYTPRLYDLVFTTRSSDSALGGHLDTKWAGPGTIVAIRGSAIVDVYPDILLHGIGGVTTTKESTGATTVQVPVEYGREVERHALVNVHHAAALQSVVHYYWGKGSRIFIDADGKLNHVILHPTDYSDDPKVIRHRRTITAHERAGLQPTTTAMPRDGSPPVQQGPDEVDVSWTSLPSNDEATIPPAPTSPLACDYGGQGGVAPSPTSTADYGGQEGEVVSVPPSSSDYGDQEGEVAPVPPSSSDYGGQEGEVAPVRPSSSDYSGQGGVAPTTTSEANCVNPGDPHGSQSSTTEHEDPATGEDHQVLPLWKTLRNEEFVRLGSTQGLSCKKFIDGSVTIPAGSVVFAFSKDYTGFAKLLRSAHCPAEALLQP